MDYSATSIVQSTPRAKYSKVAVTSRMNLFHLFPGGGTNIFLRHIALLLHILALCVDVDDLAVSWENYVGNILLIL